MKYLEISNIKIPYSVYRSLVLQLPGLRIHTLNLNHIKIEHKEMLSLLQNLENNSFIKRLDISYTSIGKSGTEELALLICKNRAIQHLNISGCVLSQKSLPFVYESLYKNNSILSFNTSHIELNYDCIEKLSYVYYYYYYSHY